MDEQATLPVASCEACERAVLVSRKLRGSSVVDECLHCGNDVEASMHLSSEELALLGYEWSLSEEACDTNGGCDDGSCGVRQPN